MISIPNPAKAGFFVACVVIMGQPIVVSQLVY